MLTTNRGISQWGEIFDDSVVAAAMLDRLLHRSVIVAIGGEPYRMRAHQQHTPHSGSDSTGIRGTCRHRHRD